MIILDPPMNYGGKFTGCSHLMSDLDGPEGSRELADFARRIGLRPAWLQHAGEPKEHYDVFASLRARAVTAGAREVGRRTMANVIRRRRGMPLFPERMP